MISVIIPTYNEERRIGEGIGLMLQEAQQGKGEYEIIIADDASTDRTAGMAQELADSAKNRRLSIRVMRNAARVGKGGTLISAAAHARGGIVVFLDADLPDNFKDIGRLADEIRNGYDIAVGSRYMEGSRAKRSPSRDWMSIAYNRFVALAFGSKIKDHQCGFKAFRKDRAMPLLLRIRDKKWFWDTEFLVKAQKQGFRIKEIPIEWAESSKSRGGARRYFWNMACGLVSLFLDVYARGNRPL